MGPTLEHDRPTTKDSLEHITMMDSNFPPPPGGFGPGPSSVSAASSASPKGGKKKRGRSKPAANSDSGTPVVTRRVISRQRGLFILFAVLVAVLVVVAITRPPAQGFVVRSTTSVGQFGTITPDQLEAVAVDEDNIEPGAITADNAEDALQEASDLVREGARLQYPLYANQQLRPEYFALDSELGEVLAPNERLISISAVAGTSVSGNIRSGDLVDVIAVSTGGAAPVAATLRTNVKVESVSLSNEQLASASDSQIDPEGENRDKSVSELVPAEVIPGTYVLRLDAAEVNKFTVADADPNTTIYLAYRPGNATDDADPTPTFLDEALGLTAN